MVHPDKVNILKNNKKKQVKKKILSCLSVARQVNQLRKDRHETVITDLAESIVMISWRNSRVCKINRIVFCKKRLVK